MIGRRTFLGQSAALWLSCALLPGCRAQVTRQTVCESLVKDVLAPDVRALVAPSTALAEAVAQLSKGDVALAAARKAFGPALLAWQRVFAFRAGPVVETNALFRSTFWPPRETSIQRAIDGEAAIDEALIESLGVDAKGLYTLELLLFAPAKADGSTLLQTERARAFAAELARDVQRRAAASVKQLGDGGDYAKRFATGAPDGVNLLINMWLETSETMAADRLGYALSLHEQGRLQAGAVPGGLSGVSADILRSWAEVMQRTYLGVADMGLSALVKQVAPAVDQRLRAAFTKTLADLTALGPTLEASAAKSPTLLADARKTVRALEILFKTELASALGVTISIVSGDGD